MTTPSFDSVEAQASYGIGLQIGQQLQESGLEGLLPEALLAGLRDAMEGNAPTVPVDVIHRALQEVHEKADKVRVERQQALVEEGKTFLEENAKRDDVTTTESGLQFSVLQAGDGPIPSKKDRVRVHYPGRLVDGTVFDSSIQRGSPIDLPVSGVIKGWVEALQLMHVGEKIELFIPSDLAYADQSPSPAIPPNSVLVFDLELLSIKDAAAPAQE